MADEQTAGAGGEGVAGAAAPPDNGAGAAAPAGTPATQGTAGAPDEDAPIQATPDEARRLNYVRHDRFGKVIQERNGLREDNARLQALIHAGIRVPAAPSAAPAVDEAAEDDPLAVAKQAREVADRTRREAETERQAGRIRTEIGRLVTDLGFEDPNDAASEIEKDLLFELQRTGSLPDLTTLANARRQKEISREAAAAARYRERKNGPAAQAARPSPASPPVVTPPPAKEKGWGPAKKRLVERLAAMARG